MIMTREQGPAGRLLFVFKQIYADKGQNSARESRNERVGG